MGRVTTNERDRSADDADMASDEALLAAVADGDQAAFAALYDRHNLLACNLAGRLLGDREAAEEVVQDVFLRLWRGAATFDPARGAARAWLLSSIHHAAISRTRGRWAHERRAVALNDRVLPPAPDDPASEVEAAERASGLRAGLATLPAAQREAVELYYFADLSGPALAARTATPLGTVKGRLRLARAQLRATLATMMVTLD